MKINEQIVLVTGGARGLGLAITQTLINEGARVVVNYLNSHDKAKELEAKYPTQIFSYRADVTDSLQVQGLFDAAHQHFGESIHSVINNALVQFEFNGDARPKVADLEWNSMQDQFQGAVKAALNTTQIALPTMK